jgi:hypothetical protein
VNSGNRHEPTQALDERLDAGTRAASRDGRRAVELDAGFATRRC